MANANRPSGLTPVAHLISGQFNGQGNIYQIAAADTNGYAIGDPVVSSGSGDANGVAGITIATNSGAIRGVILGLAPGPYGPLVNALTPNTTPRPAAAQSTDWYALVADDPNIVFSIQEVSGGTQLAAADIGTNTPLSAGSNNGYISGWQLANSGKGTTSTIQMRLLGLVQANDNAFGAYAKWLVKINNHELSAGTSGV